MNPTAAARRKERLHVLGDSELLTVQKPAQYVGGEINAVMKDDAAVELHLALAFPDTYEVGMSHLGLQILYEVVNNEASCWAERVYMPLPDMEQLLREKQLPLASLESARPLADFDLLGFSLQYELCATNILAMLELGGIPLFSADRDARYPLIIGGGPYSYHPEPLAPFFDLFFLGDAEEGIVDLLAAVREFNRSSTERDPTKRRAALLERLHKLEGIYVPRFFEPTYGVDGHLEKIRALDSEKPQVVRRLLPTMEGAPYASKPIIPNIRTVHNRLSIEVMRGCVRGCRFCQAGYLYRPQRERSPQEILAMIERALPATGFEELSLLSLSTADYCSIVPLLKALMERYGDGDRLAVSFPSTRVDALTPEVLEQVQRVRRTGFTIAPEGGSQRLRDVINKGVSDEQILETCQNVFRMGWSGIKLYFMLGNPTETDEDLQGIVDIAKRIKSLPDAKGKDITVSVSTLVPKPHTPFQWVAQISPEETVRKQRLLSDGLKRAKVNFRYHDAFSSYLEGVFARGDRRLAPVILRAYQLGCRLDAWSEHLSEERWMQAFADCGVDPQYYLRERSLTETLPWDHLSCGISKEYFAKEFSRSLRAKETADCLKKSCSICGACDYDTAKNVLWPAQESERLLGISQVAIPPHYESPDPVQRIRLQLRKRGRSRFVGHLEFALGIQRAVRRSGLPIAYSSGFHPMPRIGFGPPLALGVASEGEFADCYLTERMEPELFAAFLQQSLSEDISLVSAQEVPLRSPSLQESMRSQRFRAVFAAQNLGGVFGQLLQEHDAASCVERALDAEVKRIDQDPKRRGKSKERVFPLREHLRELSFKPAGGDYELEFSLLCDPRAASPRPAEIILTLTGLGVGEYLIEKIASDIAAETDGPVFPAPTITKQLGDYSASQC